MKKPISELTKLERWWVLAECLGKGGIRNKDNLTIHVKQGMEFIQWNPDTDKALMWDLEKEIDGSRKLISVDKVCRVYVVWLGKICEPIHAKSKEEAVQLVYIYHRLGNEVEVPEGLE